MYLSSYQEKDGYLWWRWQPRTWLPCTCCSPWIPCDGGDWPNKVAPQDGKNNNNTARNAEGDNTGKSTPVVHRPIIESLLDCIPKRNAPSSSARSINFPELVQLMMMHADVENQMERMLWGKGGDGGQALSWMRRGGRKIQVSERRGRRKEGTDNDGYVANVHDKHGGWKTKT